VPYVRRYAEWSIDIFNNDLESKHRHYFIDLYFPGLNIGIECDEAHHQGQKENDN
jgi:hypothetical protein